MLYKLTLAVFAVLTLAVSASAQRLAWTRSVGVPDDNEVVLGLCPAGNGMMVSGRVNNDSTGETRGFVMKVGPTGVVEWTRTPVGASLTIISVFPADHDEYILVAAPIANSEHQKLDFDFMLIRIDSKGSVTWKRTFTTPDRIHATHAMRTRNGDMIVDGVPTSGPRSASLRVLRIDPSGEIIWSMAMQDVLYRVYYIEELPDGDLALAGHLPHGMVILLSPSGDSVIATQSMSELSNHPRFDPASLRASCNERFEPLGIHPGSDETMLVPGTIMRRAIPPAAIPQFQVAIEKLDVLGNHLEYIPGPPGASINCTTTLSDGTIAAAGPLGSGDPSWLRLMRFDRDGNILANVTFPRASSATPHITIIQEMQDGMVVVGGTVDKGKKNVDIFLAAFTNVLGKPAPLTKKNLSSKKKK